MRSWGSLSLRWGLEFLQPGEATETPLSAGAGQRAGAGDGTRLQLSAPGLIHIPRGDRISGGGQEVGRGSITVGFELRQLHCAINGALWEECPSQQTWPGGRAAAAPLDITRFGICWSCTIPVSMRANKNSQRLTNICTAFYPAC